MIIKEPDMEQLYWIDGWVFDDDPLLTLSLRARLENRGGSGILKTHLQGEVQIAEHDIILGVVITGYQEKK